MSRSPLAYPLNRAADTDVGGAADLQTDVMRFMAILSLCLVAIFALVQSIPLTPVEPPAEREAAADPSVIEEPVTVETAPEPESEAVASTGSVSTPEPAETAAETAVVLTRPKWVPRHEPTQREQPQEIVAAEVPPATNAPASPQKEGFVLRFASDTALTRAVAAQHVGRK